MSLPTASDVHVDAVLTDYAVAYGQEIKCAADVATTVKRVEKQSDKYFIWTKADIFRSEMDKRADGAKAHVAGNRLSDTSYFAEVYALATQLTKRQRKNADFDIEKAKVRYLTQQAKLKRDKIYVANIFATGLWTSNSEQQGVTGGSPGTNEFRWFDEADSKPIEVIQNLLLTVQGSTGVLPNTMVTTRKVMQTLQRHASITDLYKHTTPGIPSPVLVAQALGVANVHIIDTVENTALEGATATMARIANNDMLLCYIAPSPSDQEATAVTSFSWSEFDQVDATGAAIRTWYDEPTKSDFFEAEMAFDCKITANDLGVYLDDCITA